MRTECCWSWMLPALALHAALLPARGQEADPPPIEDRDPSADLRVENDQEASGGPDSSPELTVTLKASSRLAFRADIGDSRSDVLVSHTPFGVGLEGPIGDSFRFRFDIGAEVTYFDFGNGESIMPGGSDPFEDLYEVRTLLSGTYLIDDHWSITALGFVRGAGEDDTDIEDAITGGGFGVVGYQFNKDFRFGLGVGATTRLEDDPLVIPYIAIYYRINEKVWIENEGLGVAIRAALTDELELSLKAAYELRDYRLNDSRPAWRSGVVEDERVPIGLELAWKPLAGLRLAIEGGAIVYQEFEFREDGSGDKLDEFETEPAAFVGVRVEYRF